MSGKKIIRGLEQALEEELRQHVAITLSLNLRAKLGPEGSERLLRVLREYAAGAVEESLRGMRDPKEES